MPLSDNKINAWDTPIVAEADQPKRSAAEMKGIFDANSNQLKAALNAVIDALIAEGGSGEIGSAQVGEGVPAGSIFSQLVKLREILNDRVQSIEVGEVRTLPTGEPAKVTITGEKPKIVLNFDLPKGNTGDGAAPHAAQHGKEGEDPVTPAAIGAATLSHAAQHAKEGEDPITPAAIGAAEALRRFTALPASGTALTNNAEYRVAASVGTYAFAWPTSPFEVWLRFSTASTFSITFPAGTKYIDGAPTFKASTPYEMSVKDGVVIAREVDA